MLAVTTFKTEAEALEIANDTMYGLGAGVWTRDTSKAYRMGRGIKAGRVWTNCYHLYPAHAAFGGYKVSGVGRENAQDDARPLHADQVPAGQLRPEAARVLLGGCGMPDETAINATAAALAELARLRERHGPLMLFQSGGCCDGSSPLCLHEGELLVGPNDLLLGEVGGVPFYIDAEQYERWNRPRFRPRSQPRNTGRVHARGGRRSSLRHA